MMNSLTTDRRAQPFRPRMFQMKMFSDVIYLHNFATARLSIVPTCPRDRVHQQGQCPPAVLQPGTASEWPHVWAQKEAPQTQPGIHQKHLCPRATAGSVAAAFPLHHHHILCLNCRIRSPALALGCQPAAPPRQHETVRDLAFLRDTRTRQLAENRGLHGQANPIDQVRRCCSWRAWRGWRLRPWEHSIII